MPYSKKAKYEHHRQKPPSEFINNSFRTVGLNHTNYKGKKFKRWKKKDSGARAVVGRKKDSGKWGIQSILIPKKKKGNK